MLTSLPVTDDISVREDRGGRLLYSEAIFDRDSVFFITNRPLYAQIILDERIALKSTVDSRTGWIAGH
jgi:hypothetical protein